MGGTTYAVNVDDNCDDTVVGDVAEQEKSRGRRRRPQVVVDSQGQVPAAVTSTSTASSDRRGSGSGRSHLEEGFLTKEDSVPTSSNIFDGREEKEDEDENEEEGGVALGRETHHSRRRFSRRGKNDDSMSSSSSGSGGDGGGGKTTMTPCFVTHGDGAREITAAASSAANWVRGAEKRVGGPVDGGNAAVVGGGGDGLYDTDGGDCSSYGSTLTLGRPEPSSVHWKYSRRLLQT